MPYINVKTTCTLDEATEIKLKSELGRAIECIPGKNESWLMVCIEDARCIYFKGNNDAPTVYAEVKIFGKSTSDAYNKMTAELCKIFDEILGVSGERVFVRYEECSIWGWNSSNF